MDYKQLKKKGKKSELNAQIKQEKNRKLKI